MATFPGKPGLAGFIEAKDDGSAGGNWSYKTCKALVKSSPLTNQRQMFYRPDPPIAQQQCQSTEGNGFREYFLAYHPYVLTIWKYDIG